MENDVELLATLAQQENELQFTTFGSETALALGLKVIELARQKGKNVTVQISVNGTLLFAHAMQGCTANQADWIRRKSNVVLRFGRSSYAVGCDYRQRGVAFDEQKHLPATEYAAFGGAFPILLRDTGMIGTAAVSGMWQAEDHALLVDALRAVLA